MGVVCSDQGMLDVHAYHRITEWFGLVGTLKIIQFQPSL